MHIRNLKLVLIALLTSFYISSLAQVKSANERIVFAFPSSKLTIDGNLSDWPVNLASHPIQSRIWGDVTDKEDISGEYKICYYPQDNALYIGITVTDNEIFNNADLAWDKQDSYSLYINEQYQNNGSGIARFSIAGSEKDKTDPSDSWDGSLIKYLNWNKFKFAVKKQAKDITYEIQFTLEELIEEGKIIGIGHMITDFDSNNDSAVGWIGRGNKDKTAQPGRIGMLVFAGSSLEVGTVSGKVKWKDSSISTQVEGVRIISRTDPEFWIHIPVERRTGEFKVTLPAGDYIMKPGKVAFFNGSTYYKADVSITKKFIVKAGDHKTLETYLLIPVDKPELAVKASSILNLRSSDKQLIDKTVRAYMDFYEIEGVALGILKMAKLPIQRLSAKTMPILVSQYRKPLYSR